jgi:hypothetical protein
MPDINKDFEFMMAILKTGTLAVNYDAAGAMLGWNKKKCVNKMSEFRGFPFFLIIPCLSFPPSAARVKWSCNMFTPKKSQEERILMLTPVSLWNRQSPRLAYQ